MCCLVPPPGPNRDVGRVVVGLLWHLPPSRKRSQVSAGPLPLHLLALPAIKHLVLGKLGRYTHKKKNTRPLSHTTYKNKFKMH